MNPPSNFSSRDVLWALSNRDILRLRHWSLNAAEGTSPLSENAPKTTESVAKQGGVKTLELH